MGRFDWLLGGDATDESDTDRDGFLSHSAEVHSLGHGLYDGMRDWRVRPGELPDVPDVQEEKHYYKGAYVLGTLLQLLVVLVTGSALGLF